MTIISCGIISIDLLFPLIMAICSSCICYMYSLSLSNPLQTIKDYPMICLSLFHFLGQLLVGILEAFRYGIEKYQFKQKESLINDLKSANTQQVTNESKYKYFYLFGQIFVVSFLNCGVIVLQSKFLINTHLYYFVSLKIGNLILTTVITLISLPFYIYPYQYVSIGIVIFGMIPMFTLDILDLISSSNEFDSWCLMLIPISVLFSIQQVAEKQIIECKNIPQYLLVAIEGVFGFFIMSIISITQFSSFTKLFDSETTLIIILIVFSYTAMNIFRIITVIYYSPIHQTIGDTLTIVFSCLIFMETFNLRSGEELSIYYLIFNSIGFVLIVIGFVMYYDIVVFYCCDLNNGTSIELERRGAQFKTKQIENDESFDISGVSHLNQRLI